MAQGRGFRPEFLTSWSNACTGIGYYDPAARIVIDNEAMIYLQVAASFEVAIYIASRMPGRRCVAAFVENGLERSN